MMEEEINHESTKLKKNEITKIFSIFHLSNSCVFAIRVFSLNMKSLKGNHYKECYDRSFMESGQA